MSDAKAGAKRGTAALFLLSAGEMRAREIYRHPLGRIGCGTGASMHWHGRHLLYSSADGHLAIVDTTSGRRRDLRVFAKALPRRSPAEHAVIAWASDYH